MSVNSANHERVEIQMTNTTHRAVDQLSDGDLLERESHDRAEFLRLDRVDPLPPDRKYRLFRTPRALLDAWVRWTQSNVAARLRGLKFRAGHDA